jgi:hypothetical protein
MYKLLIKTDSFNQNSQVPTQKMRTAFFAANRRQAAGEVS